MYFSDIFQYLYYRGIKLNPQDIKQGITFPKDLQDELHPLSQEEYKMILDVASYKNKTKYLLMGSSGMRPIEVNNIRKSDLELDKDRIIVHVPARYTKLKRGKTTFFSKEAGKLLKPLLKKLNDDDKIFGVTTEGTSNAFASYRTKVGLDKKYDSANRAMINPMSLRSWFISKISRRDPNLAKKWAGQKGYLLQYDRMTQEEQLEKYIEFESDLLVYDTAKVEAKIKKLENANKRIDDLEKRLDRHDREIQVVKEIGKLDEVIMDLMKKGNDKAYELMDKRDKLRDEYSEILDEEWANPRLKGTKES